MSERYYASSILDTVKPSNSQTTSSLTKFTEGTVTGAIIGTVGGVLYGKFSGKNIYFTGFVGMIIGGVVSKIVTM